MDARVSLVQTVEPVESSDITLVGRLQSCGRARLRRCIASVQRASDFLQLACVELVDVVPLRACRGWRKISLFRLRK